MPRLNFINEKKKKSKKIRVLTLLLLKNCNLRCVYCYEKHTQRDNSVMDISIAKAMITKYMSQDDEFDGVEIEFFGGEPMMAFQVIKETVEWCFSCNWSKSFRFLIGTNGTILNEEMKDWLYRYRQFLNVAISIDGNRTAHNITRDNSYDMIFQNLPFFTKNWPNQPAKMTIIGDTIPYIADSIIELEKMGINFTANIAFEDFWGDSVQKKKLLKIYQEQLHRLVDFYSNRPDLFPVAPLLASIPEYLGIPENDNFTWGKKDCIRFCGAGHEMVTIDVDGKNYPCHRFLPFVTGRPAPDHPTNRQTSWIPDECNKCKLVHSCPTCAGYNWEVNGDTGVRTTFHCEAYKLEVLASAKLEATRLRNRLSEVVSLTYREKRRIKIRLEAIMDLIEQGI